MGLSDRLREAKFISRLQRNYKAYKNINLFSVYLNISSQFVFLVLLWVLNIDIPTHTSETKEVKMTAPVWLRERVYLNWNHPPPTQRRFTLSSIVKRLWFLLRHNIFAEEKGSGLQILMTVLWKG